MKPNQIRIMTDYLSGHYSMTELAKKYKTVRKTIYNLIESDAGQEMIAEFREMVRRKIETNADEGLAIARNIMKNSTNETSQLRAIELMFRHAFPTRTENKNENTGNITIEFDD
jgi:predicted DNA-binding protein YlxM (UPF0122 family)